MKKKIWKKWALVGKNDIRVFCEKPKKADNGLNWRADIYTLPCKEYKLKLVEVKICK